MSKFLVMVLIVTGALAVLGGFVAYQYLEFNNLRQACLERLDRVDGEMTVTLSNLSTTATADSIAETLSSVDGVMNINVESTDQKLSNLEAEYGAEEVAEVLQELGTNPLSPVLRVQYIGNVSTVKSSIESVLLNRFSGAVFTVENADAKTQYTVLREIPFDWTFMRSSSQGDDVSPVSHNELYKQQFKSCIAGQ